MSKLNATFVPVKSFFQSRQLVRLTILLLLLQLLTPLPNLRLRHVQAAALPPTIAPPPAKAPSAARVAEKLGQMPMTFEQNLGQTDARVQFTARGKGYQLFLTPTEAMLSLPQGKNKRPLALRMQLVGGNPSAVVTGLEKTGTVSNYYLGNDPSKFRTGVPHFAKVKYAQVYPGIDAIYYGNQRMLEYDFVVAPGVDPRVIQMAFKGAQKLSLDSNGDLVIQTKGGELRHHKPTLYQTINGARQEVAGSFKLHGKQVGFAIGEYDRTKELVIDPTLNYSTYLGGYDGDEKGYAITLDGSSNAYLTGEVASTGAPYAFPDGNITGESSGGKDIFVAKLNSSGTGVSFYTFVGSTGDEWGTGIALDSSGNVFAAGILGTNSFAPGVSGYVTSDPSTTTEDAFVLKLNSSGALQKFTYLGGDGADKANGIAVDGDNVFVVGQTFSSNFPTASPYDSSSNGQADVFVAKLSNDLTTLSYSTYLGGTNNDYGLAIAVKSGLAYVTGYTQSSNFPTNSAFDNTITGSAPIDAFVAKIDPAGGGSGLSYSTFLGGNGREEGNGIAVNSSGEAFVTGRTHSAGASVSGYTSTSTGFPYTSGVAQTSQAGYGDAFVTRFNSSGNGLVYSTLLGGAEQDIGYSIALDSNGKILITGETDSTDFPTKPGYFQLDQTGTDAFVSRIDPAGTGSNDLDFSTYFGGGSTDSGRGIAASGSVAYLVGFTNSASDQYGGAFKVAPSGSIYQDDVAGGFDSFAAKITP
jgi:hypothetical protein